MAIEMEMKVGQLFLSIFVKSRSFPHNEGSKSVITLKPGPAFPWGGRFWPQEPLTVGPQSHVDEIVGSSLQTGALESGLNSR